MQFRPTSIMLNLIFIKLHKQMHSIMTNCQDHRRRLGGYTIADVLRNVGPRWEHKSSYCSACLLHVLMAAQSEASITEVVFSFTVTHSQWSQHTADLIFITIPSLYEWKKIEQQLQAISPLISNELDRISLLCFHLLLHHAYQDGCTQSYHALSF